MRLVQYELSIYGADLQEQCDAAGITRNVCPHCEAKGAKLGDCQCHAPRSSQGILDLIQKVLLEFHYVYGRYPNPLEFWDAGKKYNLNGVQKPFWRKLPGVDIATLLSPDLLHGVHKMFFDHFHQWNINGIGAEEFDTCLRAQPETPGERTFPQGVLQLKQLAGKDHRALERVHMAIVAHALIRNSGGGESRKLTNATRGLLNCVFIAQLPVQTENALEAFEQAYRTYQANKEVWVENKSKHSKKGKKLVKAWAIPKQHIMRHIPDHIRWKGMLDNCNTETMEHLHGPMLKEPWRGLNRKGWIRQAIHWLARRSNMRGYYEFMVWLEATRQVERAQPDELDRPELIRIDEDEEEIYNESEDDDFNPESYEEDEEDDEDGDEDEDDGDNSGEEGEETEEAEVEFTREPEGSRQRDEGQWDKGQWDNRGEDWIPEGGGEAERVQDPGQGPTPGEPPEHSEPPEPPEPNAEPERPSMDEVAYTFINLFLQTTSANENNYARTWMIEDNVLWGNTVTPFPLYRVAKLPSIRSITVGDVMSRMRLPKFLHHIRQHPYFAMLGGTVDARTPLNVWNILRITIPTSLFCPTKKIRTLYAQSGLDGKDPRWDAGFYVPTDAPGARRPELETIHDFSVGRIALIFALSPSRNRPVPRLMLYMQRFTNIPASPGNNTGLLSISKKTEGGSLRYEIVAASQLARPCPLAPVIKGPAIPGVVGHDSFNHYKQFFINKYRTPYDFFFLHSF
ncbi:hypothetical protein FRC07_001561 [Ceratobasidium sp. 392]|nr:hypothetical protein FRC07_001561 [Ceratobasidium sp. 392]